MEAKSSNEPHTERKKKAARINKMPQQFVRMKKGIAFAGWPCVSVRVNTHNKYTGQIVVATNREGLLPI